MTPYEAGRGGCEHSVSSLQDLCPAFGPRPLGAANPSGSIIEHRSVSRVVPRLDVELGHHLYDP